MVRKLAILGFISLLLVACTEVEYEESLPDTSGLTPLSIDTDLPVVELFADPAEFDRMYQNFDAKITIPGRMRMLNSQSELQLDTTLVALEIKGASSASYVMKSLGITFAEDVPNYMLRIVDPPIVGADDNLRFLKSIRLRNSGNDFGGSMFKDLAYHRFALACDVDFELMYGSPVQVFVNGAYFGLLNLRTESSREGVSRLHGVETDDLIMMEVDVKNGNLEDDEGNGSYAYQMRNAIDDRDALKLYQMIDIPNFIDYVIFQDYIGNRDWPHNNVKAHSINGSPWRFFLFDTDKGSLAGKLSKLAELEYENDDLGKIYQALITVPGFSEQLKKRQRELYARFRPELFAHIVDELAEQFEDEIPYLISKYQQPPSSFHWKMSVEELKRDFERRDHFIRQKYQL